MTDYIKKALPGNLVNIGWTLLGAGILLGLLGFFIDFNRALFAYLVAFLFILSIAAGALFLIALEYITGADWSVPIRRVVEFLASVLPLLIIIVLPLLFNMDQIFHWAQKEAAAKDALLQHKSPYLNVPFFLIRVFAVFIIWGLFYYLLNKNSEKQDLNGDQSLTKKNIVLSGLFMPVFAITITVASIDWTMSIEPHWFSTIFGVYFFSGTVVGSLAAITLIVVLLMEKGYLHPKMNNEHLYSLGALTFAFINFWGYIAFSQYLLIWYADLPEENFWFLTRWHGGWQFFSIALIVVHFVIPYALLLSQPSKMNPKRLKFTAVWLLAAHLLDLYWLAMPSLLNHGKGYSFSWIDFVFPASTVGLFIIIFFTRAQRNNLVPVKDPKLERGLNFRLN
ncbi:MAG: quinol:cytochrome C oxidoreductase [Ignavibacteria bacterium]